MIGAHGLPGAQITRNPSQQYRNFNQQTLSGGTHSGESFGNALQRCAESTLRIVFQNVNNLPKDHWFSNSCTLVSNTVLKQIDILAVAETGPYWPKLDTDDKREMRWEVLRRLPFHLFLQPTRA